MLRFELYDDEKETRIDLGLIGNFVSEVVKDMRDMNFRARILKPEKLVPKTGMLSKKATIEIGTSKMFSKEMAIDPTSIQELVDQDQLDKELAFALDRVIQKIRDERL